MLKSNASGPHISNMFHFGGTDVGILLVDSFVMICNEMILNQSLIQNAFITFLF
jgi:hypothetical protein